jgi:D-sedoheptulose 7-phosphate isomerase
MKLEIAADQLVSERIQDHLSITSQLLSDVSYLRTVTEVADAAIAAIRNGHKLLFFGNGGSAADSQHLTAEMTGRYLKERPSIPAISLTANTSSLTAIGNDYSYDLVFARQMEALGNPGDMAIGISTSGSSVNVIRALEIARRKKLITIGLTGRNGAKLKTVVDYCIEIPSTSTPRIQEAHILTGHIICELIENGLFEK